MKSRQGFTAMELLIVVAILGIVAGTTIITGGKTIKNSQEAGAVKTLQQSIWQGATSASSRGAITSLSKSGNIFTLKNESTGKNIRTFEIPSTVSININDGKFLEFLPPGEIKSSSYSALPSPLKVVTPQKTYKLSISIIGDVKAEVIP